MSYSNYPRPMLMQRHAQKAKGEPAGTDPREKPVLPELNKDPDNPLQLPDDYESDRVGCQKPKVVRSAES